MDRSSSWEEINRRRREEIYCLDSPCCYFCNKFVQAIMKCLGVEIHDQPASSPSYAREESFAKPNEEMEVTDASTRSITAAGRRPTRPPVSTGSGGQIN
ncbi:hypothetical protein K2173_014859 [Erythroxylum novogranatense]|uniref:Uncharacterized protein n=1 Tax=Erythroxylum novogranatense TaxID=1862640 RepID=A0AAV8TG00_9ROSI|nr:hypothetical protein K2173_014859 [Erythroxylum novogranatense]